MTTREYNRTFGCIIDEIVNLHRKARDTREKHDGKHDLKLRRPNQRAAAFGQSQSGTAVLDNPTAASAASAAPTATPTAVRPDMMADYTQPFVIDFAAKSDAELNKIITEGLNYIDALDRKKQATFRGKLIGAMQEIHARFTAKKKDKARKDEYILGARTYGEYLELFGLNASTVRTWRQRLNEAEEKALEILEDRDSTETTEMVDGRTPEERAAAAHGITDSLPNLGYFVSAFGPQNVDGKVWDYEVAIMNADDVTDGSRFVTSGENREELTKDMKRRFPGKKVVVARTKTKDNPWTLRESMRAKIEGLKNDANRLAEMLTMTWTASQDTTHPGNENVFSILESFKADDLSTSVTNLEHFIEQVTRLEDGVSPASIILPVIRSEASEANEAEAA